jgi:hypothetical protein
MVLNLDVSAIVYHRYNRIDGGIVNMIAWSTVYGEFAHQSIKACSIKETA